MKNLYKKLASSYVLWGSFFLGLLCLVLFWYFDNTRPKNSPGPLAIQFVYSQDAFQNILRLWGVEGIQVFKNILYVDYFFPIAYAFFLSSLLVRCHSRIRHPQVPLCHPERSEGSIFFILPLPFVAALLDFCENTIHLLILNGLFKISYFSVLSASLCALAKWVLVAISFIYIFTAYFRLRR